MNNVGYVITYVFGAFVVVVVVDVSVVVVDVVVVVAHVCVVVVDVEALTDLLATFTTPDLPRVHYHSFQFSLN